MKELVVVCSLGDSVEGEIPVTLQNYCDQLNAVYPKSAFEDDLLERNLGQLHLLMLAKASRVAENVYRVIVTWQPIKRAGVYGHTISVDGKTWIPNRTGLIYPVVHEPTRKNCFLGIGFGNSLP